MLPPSRVTPWTRSQNPGGGRSAPAPSPTSVSISAQALGALLASLCALAGCFSLRVPSPRIQEYRLAYPSPAVEGAPVPVVLRLAPFRTASVYARESIVYRESAHTIGTYDYHRWAADPGSMIADLLARDFAASGLYRAVQQGPSPLRSDYELSGEIEQIEEQLLSGCASHLQLRALLLRAPAAKRDPVLFQQTYAASEPCIADDTADMVAAMSRALQQISIRLQQDVHGAIAADQGSEEGRVTKAE